MRCGYPLLLIPISKSSVFARAAHGRQARHQHRLQLRGAQGSPGRGDLSGAVHRQPDQRLDQLRRHRFELGQHLADVKKDDGKQPGKNLLDIIKNVDSSYRQAVFSMLGTQVMIRTANWKMVFDPEQQGVCHLFDLLNDPQELRNLAGVPGYEAITAKLQEQLLSFCINLHQNFGPAEQAIVQKVRTMFSA